MRLSEAIALGSTVMKAVPGTQCDGPNMEYGCALGMAAKARGGGIVVTEPSLGRAGGNYWDMIWPWTMHYVRRPCWCWPLKKKMLVKEVITHLFDVHVFRRSNWTLDQLIDWVKSVEPEEMPSPNEAVAESVANAEV